MGSSLELSAPKRALDSDGRAFGLAHGHHLAFYLEFGGIPPTFVHSKGCQAMCAGVYARTDHHPGEPVAYTELKCLVLAYDIIEGAHEL